MNRILPDAAVDNWVDRRAPAPWRPWLKLARVDRPIGVWLLMLPGWQGVALAGAMAHRSPDLTRLGLIALGALLMRSAGCAINDIFDRHIDVKVARTAARPVASGQISVRAAWAFAVICTLASVIVLLALNLASLWIAVASLPLVILYPFMKRLTWWPQAWLGLTFNWGVLLGFAAALGGPPLAAILVHASPLAGATHLLALADAWTWRAPLALYASGVFWTLGYDTIYAIQDMDDDIKAGVKSSALKLGARAPAGILSFYAASLVLALAAGLFARLGPLFYLGLVGLLVHFVHQVRRLEVQSSARALAVFKSNATAGLILFVACAAGAWRF